jgi:CRP-like cAMP-binding protein
MLQHFGSGEKVLRQGDLGNSLYIIVSGRASLTTTDLWGHEQEVLALKAGDFFGITTLFSGEPSDVSVTAIDDLEVMMIAATVVNQMIERQPSFAREISQVLEIRRRAIQAVKQTEGTNDPAVESRSF